MQFNKQNLIVFEPDFETILNLSPGYIYWKDLNSIYLGGNQNLINILGFTTSKELIGKTDYDIVDQQAAKEFISQDQYVMRTGKVHISERETLIIKNNKKLFLRNEKNPLYNKSGKLIGMIGVSVDITAEKEAERLKKENYQAVLSFQERFSDFINAVMNLAHNYKIDIFNEKLGLNTSIKSLTEIKLSKREEQVLYFLLMGKTSKDIALILSKLGGKPISHLTVASVINKQLYLKLDVSNYSQLIEKATRLHLVPFIPKSLSYFLGKNFDEL